MKCPLKESIHNEACNLFDKADRGVKSEDIYPCPFCGDYDLDYGSTCRPDSFWDGGMRGEEYAYIKCHKCGVIMKSTDMKSVVNKWNIRNGINNDNTFRTYHVWSEGFSVTGMYQPDFFMGSYDAYSFREACMKAMRDNDYSEEDIKEYYDPKKNSYWGCSFYEQAPDAKPKYFEELKRKPLPTKPETVNTDNLQECIDKLDAIADMARKKGQES